jgi:PAS domain S-box-containing protein
MRLSVEGIAAADSPGPAARRVLVVDDDEGLNRLARKTLRRAGFETEGAPTGGAAMARAMDDPGLALLLDHQLPDMTGAELVRALAAEGRRPPFVAMTGQGDETVAVEMMKLGARDYLIKGVDLTGLLPEVFRRLFREWETERRLARAERELREREERYARLFNGVSDAIFVHLMEGGRPGRFIEVNDVACARLGYSREELLRLSPMDIDEREMSEGRRAALLSLAKTGHAVFEMVHVAKSGERIPVEISARSFEDGGRPCMLSIARDVTARKRNEAERVRLEEQVQRVQRMESIGRLAGGVAHDLNNLLSPILGYGEMLLEDTAPGDGRREPLEQIVSAGIRSRDLVRQLLAFSRKQTLEFQTVNLNALLRDFEKLLRRTIRENVDIRLRLDETPPLLMGDVGQLEQVVMNLAVNAQDAMPGGGVMTIQTETGPPPPEDPALSEEGPPGPHVRLAVTDTGHGMDANAREHLFEPFFTTKDVNKGTGLGLATVYGIVKQHRGIVRGDNRPEGGAIFQVWLPACAEAAETSPAGARPAPAETPNGSETILLVEDNEQVRTLARIVLAREGYTVLEADGGSRALDLLAEHEGPVHLLLTDVVMPEMNGKELFRRVNRRRPEVRALYMSGYTDDVIAEAGVMDAEVHFIQKPFSVRALSAKVREVLGAAGADCILP